MNPFLRVAAGTLGGICAAAALFLSSTAATTAPSASVSADESAEFAGVSSSTATGSAGGLTVSPSTGLFNVVLERGQREQRRATLTNASTGAVTVHLSALVTDQQGHPGSTDQVLLAASSGACPDVHEVALTSGDSIEHARLDAGETRDVCISVALPADGEPAPPGTVTADLRFESIDVGDQLATTGADAPSIALGIAAAALIAGAVLGGARKKTEHA